MEKGYQKIKKRRSTNYKLSIDVDSPITDFIYYNDKEILKNVLSGEFKSLTESTMIVICLSIIFSTRFEWTVRWLD